MMATEHLNERIRRFRREYLGTAEGRAHLQTEEDEPREVQAIFRQLRQRKEAGEDITDDALKKLLPHQNTQYNRDRGARISTWPCITKDVKMWFEGANWKQPGEWPAAADWLLAICEAGKNEDWPTWRSLARQPSQKGFACGFITPIVHCLNPKLPVINSKVVKTYDTVAGDLGLGTRISSDLEEYPDNKQLLADLVARLNSLGIDGLREWDVFCHWNVAKKLGGRPVDLPPPPPPPPPVPSPDPPLSQIAADLRTTQHDTRNPDRFERALAVAFQVLGFETDHIGGAGEADVVASAMLGDESFSVVLDAKTCQESGSRGNINYDPLKKHQEQHEADFAVVVAPAFAKGDTITHAENRGVGLLTTERLIALVEESENCGLSLFALKEVLNRQGLIEIDIARCRGIRGDLTQAALAVLKVFELHQRPAESSTGFEPQAVYWMLQGGGAKFLQQHVDSAIQLLANPIVGVLEKKDGGFVLTLPAAKATVRIQSVARAFAGLVNVGDTVSNG